MNYSCRLILEMNRLMEIPLSLKKLLNNKYDLDETESSDAQGEIAKSKYYLKGIQQNLLNVKDVGILNILALILNKPVYDTLHLITSFLISNPSILSNILGGKLLNYVQNIKEFILLINKTFNNKIDLSDIIKFEMWNEFFIEISKYFGIVYIMIEEVDNNVLNDSKLQLLIPDNVREVSDYIYNNNNYKYALICKRIIHNKIYYLPILKLYYREYYLNNNQFNILFKYDDQIILKIKNILKVTLTKIKTNIENSNTAGNISLDQINEFILYYNKKDIKYNIAKYFLNKHNEIYSILIEIKKYNSNASKEYIYLNVDKQTVSNVSYKEMLKSKLYDFQSIKLQQYNIKYNNILRFINHINEFVYSMYKTNYSELYLKMYFNKLIQLNVDSSKNTHVLDMNEALLYNNETYNKYKYIRIQSFIISNVSNKYRIIGFICNNLNFYFTDQLEISKCIDYIKNKYNDIRKLFTQASLKKHNIKDIIRRDISLENNNYQYYLPMELDIDNYKNYFRYYKYDPIMINSIINTSTIVEDKRHLGINNAIYNTNIYNLLMLHIIDIIKKIKNQSLRNKCKIIISNFTKNDIEEINVNKTNNKIYNIINEYILKKDRLETNQQTYFIENIYTNIILLLKNIISSNKFNNTQLPKLKELCLNVFDNTRFEFDNIYLYDLLLLEKNKFIEKLNNMLEDVITFKNPNNKDKIVDLTLCRNIKKSYYCDNYKLIINKELYKTMIEIFYYDITNPFKQDVLLNFTDINKDLYKFNNYINEKIFIYY
jgi:hypothetical protein